MRSWLIWSLLVCLSSAAAPCDFPPSLWCSSREIASLCQVVPQCEGHFMRTANAEPVKLSVYIEALCPDCKDFIRQHLWPTWQKLSSYISLNIVPYGNGEEHWNGRAWQFTCQHGPDECMGNLIETCAIASVNYDANKYFPFINCIEAKEAIPSKTAAECARKSQLDYISIMKCVNGPEGSKLQHQMALMTKALNPPHQYVPWVTLNGVHTEEIQMAAQTNLLKLICDTYKGTPPPVCTSEQELYPQPSCINNNQNFNQNN